MERVHKANLLVILAGEYFPTFDEIESFLLKSCAHGDLLITMGAGDVVNIGEHLLGK